MWRPSSAQWAAGSRSRGAARRSSFPWSRGRGWTASASCPGQSQTPKAGHVHILETKSSPDSMHDGYEWVLRSEPWGGFHPYPAHRGPACPAGQTTASYHQRWWGMAEDCQAQCLRPSHPGRRINTFTFGSRWWVTPHEMGIFNFMVRNKPNELQVTQNCGCRSVATQSAAALNILML